MYIFPLGKAFRAISLVRDGIDLMPCGCRTIINDSPRTFVIIYKLNLGYFERG